MYKKIITVLFGLLLSPALCFAVGDTQGKITEVKVVADDLCGNNYILIRFSQAVADIDNDRFGCIAGAGYVQFTTSHSQISTTTLALHYSNAMSAQKAQKSLAIDSFGTDSCLNGAHSWVVY